MTEKNTLCYETKITRLASVKSEKQFWLAVKLKIYFSPHNKAHIATLVCVKVQKTIPFSRPAKNYFTFAALHS